MEAALDTSANQRFLLDTALSAVNAFCTTSCFEKAIATHCVHSAIGDAKQEGAGDPHIQSLVTDASSWLHMWPSMKAALQRSWPMPVFWHYCEEERLRPIPATSLCQPLPKLTPNKHQRHEKFCPSNLNSHDFRGAVQ